MNNLLYVGAYVVTEKLEKRKENKSSEKRKEPWWKRKIEANIAEWRKDVSRLNYLFEFEKKDLDRMGKKYQMSDVRNVQVIYMLKEKIQQMLYR